MRQVQAMHDIEWLFNPPPLTTRGFGGEFLYYSDFTKLDVNKERSAHHKIKQILNNSQGQSWSANLEL